MSTVQAGADLFDRRHHRVADKPLTKADVKSSGIAAGVARWQAMHATKPIVAADGSIVQRPDPDARAAARALLSPEDQAEVDRDSASAAGYDV